MTLLSHFLVQAHITHFYPKFYPNIFTKYLCSGISVYPRISVSVHLPFTSRTLFAKIFKPFINNRCIHHHYHSLIYIHFHKSTLLKITLFKIQKCQTIINKLTNEIRLNSWNWYYLHIAFSRAPTNRTFSIFWIGFLYLI